MIQAEQLLNTIEKLGIDKVVGVPDSTLKEFCQELNKNIRFNQRTVANEGSAVGLAVGHYLATGLPACVYMQNSGIGNAINPITSIVNKEIYGIPMLFVIGWRGDGEKKDEPQHQFMGKITLPMIELLGVKTAIVSKDTTCSELENIEREAMLALNANEQYAIIIKRDAFIETETDLPKNTYTINREWAIKTILSHTNPSDVVVSTTGKISREVYEQSDEIYGQHQQDFMTIGGMGHTSMITLGLAMEKPEKKVICIDGDGALLMHMGNLAVIAKDNPDNLVHICLNNDAHESVGGMPTGAVGLNYAEVASACGYPRVIVIEAVEELDATLENVLGKQGLTFIEIKVAMESRSNLGRPKETARENKEEFMKYHKVGERREL